MNSKVLATINAYDLIHKGDRVIVALSGGADSVTLLTVLLSLKNMLGIQVWAAHVNHNLRGEESNRDEAFVRKLCEKRNVRLFVKSVDVKALSQEKHQGFETVGRQVRYDFFDELSQKHNALIATAHTASDALETALLNLARGASLSGLCSIPYKRGRIIRPLLDVKREEIESYALKNSLSFVNDSTNGDAEICARNRVRHRVVPELKSINFSVEDNYIRLRKNLSQTDSYVREQAHKLLETARTEYGYDAATLVKAHSALVSCAIGILLEQKTVTYESKHIELIKACLESTGAVDLQNGVCAVVKQGMLTIGKKSSVFSTALLFSLGGKHTFDEKVYEAKVLKSSEIVYKKLSTLCIGCDKISLGAVLRTRRQGDRFSLAKRGITKDLRKLQNELKIPATLRDRMLLLESDGKILWAEGIGVSAFGVYSGGDGVIIEIREDKGNA